MVIMIRSEHLSDEQLGIGRLDCNAQEKAMLAAMSADYIGKLAAKLEVPPSSFSERGPFFPARATYAHLAPPQPTHYSSIERVVVPSAQNITPGI